ncbi:hypothetical protein D3C81_2083930 [compost metagenome]
MVKARSTENTSGRMVRKTTATKGIASTRYAKCLRPMYLSDWPKDRMCSCFARAAPTINASLIFSR